MSILPDAVPEMPDQKLSKSVETLPNAAAFSIGGLEFDPEGRELRGGGRSLRLEPKAVELLAVLAARRGEPIARNDLLDAVWGDEGSDEALTQTVSRIRRLVRDLGGQPGVVETVPRVGYRLTPANEAPRPLSVPAALQIRPVASHALAFAGGAIIGAAALALWFALAFQPQTDNQTVIMGPDGQVIRSGD
jgi:DNA-binding winged helix-turn-helix (wHTH) protein